MNTVSIVSVLENSENSDEGAESIVQSGKESFEQYKALVCTKFDEFGPTTNFEISPFLTGLFGQSFLFLINTYH